jgi:Zn ribbon nucleic-acid-binding protein
MERKRTMKRTQVEGIDYSPEGIEELRQELIVQRGEAMKAWPEGIHATVVLSHLIALLADYKEMREAEEAWWVCPQCNTPGEPKVLADHEGVRLLECPKCYHQFELSERPVLYSNSEGEHTASWTRRDEGGIVRVTARWKDSEPTEAG